MPQQGVPVMTRGEIVTAYEEMSRAFLTIGKYLRPSTKRSFIADLKYYEKEFNRGKS